jgi:osmotically inducible lipoprotein OsmB
MRKLTMIGIVLASCAATPAYAASERTLTGVAIGAGTGALVAGPVGAVVGGVIGGAVGGPKFSRNSGRRCWYDRGGYRHCRYY